MPVFKKKKKAPAAEPVRKKSKFKKPVRDDDDDDDEEEEEKPRKSSKSSKSEKSDGVLGRGYAKVRQAKKEQEIYQQQSKNRVYEFWIQKDEEAEMRFLTEEPITFKRHSMPKAGRFEQYTCPGVGCPICAKGDNPRFVGAYLVVDRRTFESKKDNSKGKQLKNQVRLFVQGTNVLSQLDRNSEKYGLINREWTVARTANAYNWDRGEKCKLLPSLEKLLKDFDKKDPYDIVLDNVKALSIKDLNVKFGDSDDDEEEERSARSVSKKVKKFANL